MSDIPNFVRDDKDVEISCRSCGTRFTKRTDEGVSQCYDCYVNSPVTKLLADLKEKYGSFEFADHISKTKMRVFECWFLDAANQIYAEGYKHGMEGKTFEAPIK